MPSAPHPDKPPRKEMFNFLNSIRMSTTHARTADPFNAAADLPDGFLADWAALQADLRANPPAAD
jgi:hypothetical protein